MAKSSFENAIPIKGMTANEKNALADSILKQISSNKKNVEETVDVQFKVNTVLDINGAKVDITKKYSDLRNTILEEQKKTQKIINKKRKSTGSGYSKMAVTEDMEGRASRITTEALRNGLKRSDEDSFNKILLTREKIIKKLNDLESERSEISKQSFSSAKADAILENLQKQLALRQKLRDVEETKKYQGFMPQSGITADDKIFNQKILDERKKLSSEAFDFYNKNLEELDKKTNTFIDKVKQSGNINEEYIDSDAYVRKFQEAEESSRQLISSIQESSKSTTNYIEKYGKDVLQLAKNIDTIYNNAMSNHGNLSDIDPRTLKKMAEMYSVLDHITDGKWMDMEIDSDLLYSLDEVSNFLYEESQNSGSSVEKIINAVTIALTKMGSAAKVALPALEGVSSEVTGTKSVSNTDLYDKMIGWSNEERLLYKKGTPSNERFAFANLDTGYMGKIGISDKLHGVSGSLIDAAFKQAEETVNAFVHSHTDVGPAAFSIRDIENAFDSLSDGINYQILKSIDEIAIFDASKIDASKQDSILKDMKSIFSGKLGDALDDNRKYGMLFTELGDSLNQELTNAINSALQKSLNIEGYSNIKSRFSDQIRNNIISDIATSIMSNGPDVAVPDPSMIQDSIFNIFEKYRNELKSLSNEASFGNEIDRFFEDFQLDLADNFIELWDKVPANKYFSNDYYNSIIQESLIESLKKNGYETNWKDVYKIMPIEQFVASKPQQETGINGTQGSEERAAAVRKEASAHRENAQAITEEEEARSGLNEIIASNNEDTSAPILAEAEAHQANADAMSEEQKARDSLDDEGGQTSSLPADSVPVESAPVTSEAGIQEMERLADAAETVTSAINEEAEAFENEQTSSHSAIESELDDLQRIEHEVSEVRNSIENVGSENVSTSNEQANAEEKKSKAIRETTSETKKATSAALKRKSAEESVDNNSDVSSAIDKANAIKDSLLKASESLKTEGFFAKDLDKDIQGIQSLIDDLDSGSISLEEFQDQLSKVKSEIDGFSNDVKDAFDINDALNKARTALEDFSNDSNKVLYFSEVLKNAKNDVSSLDKQLINGEISLKKYNESIEKIVKSLSNSKWNRKGTETGVLISKDSSIYELEASMRKVAEATEGVIPSSIKFNEQSKKMTFNVKDANGNLKKYTIALNETTRELNKYNTSTVMAKSLTEKFGNFIKTNSAKVLSYVASFGSFYKAWSVLKQGVSIVSELDKSFTEMRKVSDESVESLREYSKEAFKLASQTGSTASVIQNSTADWMRLGEAIDQAKQSAKDTAILMNVSEFTDISEATDSLVSMSQAYKELDKIDIIDKLNLTGNNFSISTSDLAQSLQRSAASLKVAGNDINEAIALTVAGNSILQDPDSVAAGLRTISMRITGTTAEELEAIGEDSEGLIETTSKLKSEIESLTSVNGKMGVSITDANGKYKNTYQILSEIADRWEEIGKQDAFDGKNRQNAILEDLAGKNRSSILASILQNPELLKKVYAEVQDSAGSAEQELAKYLDSVEGKLNSLTNTWQEFWSKSINSEAIKSVLDLSKGFMELANSAGGLVPIAKNLIIAFASFKGLGKRISCSYLYYNTKCRVLTA